MKPLEAHALGLHYRGARFEDVQVHGSHSVSRMTDPAHHLLELFGHRKSEVISTETDPPALGEARADLQFSALQQFGMGREALPDCGVHVVIGHQFVVTWVGHAIS